MAATHQTHTHNRSALRHASICRTSSGREQGRTWVVHWLSRIDHVLHGAELQAQLPPLALGLADLAGGQREGEAGRLRVRACSAAASSGVGQGGLVVASGSVALGTSDARQRLQPQHRVLQKAQRRQVEAPPAAVQRAQVRADQTLADTG